MNMMEKIKCEVCGCYFYIEKNENRNIKYRNNKKCPSCRASVPLWSEEDIEKLRFLRRNTHDSLDTIAKKLGRTREACSNKLIRMRVRKNRLKEYRRAKCVLCGEERGRYTAKWARKLENKFVCAGCREAFGKIKRIDDVIFIKINKDLYYPLHYLIWLLNKKSLPYRGILTHLEEKDNNDISNLVILPIEGEDND